MNQPDASPAAVRTRRDPQALACLAGASASLVLMVLTLWLA
jgi:hypothetical protein